MSGKQDLHTCRCKACHCPNNAVNADVCYSCGQGIHKPRARR